ncbi:MAG: DUF6279 family lipoprotein [Burkholderiales bacterium]
MKRAVKAFLLVLLAVAAGCSTIRFGYNQADTIVVYMTNDYFNLDAAQEQDFRRRLDRLLAWHRRTQLPDYARFLTEARTRLERGPATADVTWFVDGIRDRYRTVVRQSFDDAIAIAVTLTPEQLHHLQRQFDKDNAKFVKDTALERGTEERKLAQFKKTLGQAEDWAGDLNREQAAQLREMVFAMPLVNHLRDEDRRRRQHELIEILKLRHDRAQFAPRLRAWLLDWEAGRSPEYEKVVTVAYEERAQIFVRTWKMFTPAQRTHAVKRLQGYVDDLNALSATPAGTTAAPAKGAI